MTIHGNCLECGAICEPGFNTCSQECNLAYRKNDRRKKAGGGLGDVPEGYFTLSEIAVKLGLSPATLYARKLNPGFPKGIAGHYSLEEVANLGIKPRRRSGDAGKEMGQPIIDDPMRDSVAHVMNMPPGSVQVGPVSVIGPDEYKAPEPVELPPPAVGPKSTSNLKAEKARIEGEIKQINAQLPKVIRQRMLTAAKEAAKDACLEAADEARKRGDHWLRAQCLEDYVHLEEGLKMIFNGEEL